MIVALDEHLRRAIDDAGEPADPSGVYENLVRRRERRRIARTLRTSALAIVVVLGSAAGLYGLSRVFGTDQSATIGGAPVGGRITFVRYDSTEQGDRTSILSVEPDGLDPHELLHHAGIVTDLDWSADGTRLLYGRGDLFVFDQEIGQSARIATDAYGASWSPDGSQIAFATDTAGRDAIIIVDADGTEEKMIDLPYDDLGWTDWSPDGSKILFVGPGPNGAYHGWDIYVMDADGSGVTKLTDTPEVELDPGWSPDGSTILFKRGPLESSGTSDLYTMASDGSDVRRLTNDDVLEQSPVWSPDGSLIAFTGMAHEGTAIYTILADGTARTKILDADAITLAWEPVSEGATVPPTPSETTTPTPSPTQNVGEDIGLGFPVCNVTSVAGVFAPGVDGMAWVATKTGDVGCPSLGDGMQVVAVDVSGDGVADTSFGPLECDPWCSAFAAPDVDGDGTDELLIQNIQFTIAGLRLYDVRSDPQATVGPVTVASPGYPGEDLAPGAEPQFWIGGDAFDSETLRCFEDESPPAGPGRVLIQTSATQVPPDSPDAMWHATETWFDLQPDGTVTIVDRGDFEEPIGSGPPSFAQPNRLCGARLPPPFGG